MSTSGSVRFVAEHDFIRLLVSQIRAGFGLIPFLGSGCSAHSGILMGGQFNDYLAWTVALCVADRRRWSCFGDRWDLRTQGWPRDPTHADLTAARAWALHGFRHLAERCDFYVDDNPATTRVRGMTRTGGDTNDPETLTRVLYAPLVPPFLRDSSARHAELADGRAQRELHRLLTKDGLVHGGLLLPGVSPTSEDAITERAIRSLHDWRSTLHFLSELKLGRDGKTLFLEQADPSVIDNFNVHITRGRRPNLIHSMLCHLRQPARMRLLLTTNFDTLIEDAFAQQRRRLEVISVSVRGSLPDPEIVHARDTVVKLHGTFSETRADFSLDERPTLEDRKRFFHYVRGHYPEAIEPSFVPSHLLVAGYSGSDARCVDMMKTVLEGDRLSLIFWICHCPGDRRRLTEIFPERAYGPRVIATDSERVDLLLYEFHQQLCLTLPPGGGSSYHINHNVAPAASFRLDDEGADDPSPGAQLIVEKADWIGDMDPLSRALVTHPPERKILVVDGQSGVLTAMRGALEQLAQKNGIQKVWLELEDYSDTASLAHDLFQIIASRRGVLHLSHAELCIPELCDPELSGPPIDGSWGSRLARRWTEHIELLKEYLGIDPTQWVIALYGRNGPGGCTGWSENQFFWGVAEYGDATRYGPFLAFLIGLKDAGFNVFYAPYSEMRRDRDLLRRQELIEALLEAKALMLDRRDQAQAIVERSFFIPQHTHELDAPESLASYKRFFQAESAAKDADPESCPMPTRHWVRLDLPAEHSRKRRDQFGQTVRKLLRQALHLDVQLVSEAPGHTGEGAGFGTAVHLLPIARYTVLYGASLFRQSRHYSAFFTEGVFPCPRRFNIEGFDNDLLRHTSLEQLLTTLDHDPRVFLRKPGGFAWLYRNTRLALRCLVEAASDAASKQQGSGILPAGEFRARCHFYIGDWYLRAFYVSGNAGPLMEAAYHFFQSTIHAADAREHRKVIWRRGLHQLVKTLRRGDAPLRLWFGHGQLANWFKRSQATDERDSDYSPRGLRRQVEAAWNRCADGEPLNETDENALLLLEAELVQLGRLSAIRSPIYSFLSLQGVPPRRELASGASGSAIDVQQKSLPPPAPTADGLDLVTADWWRAANPTNRMRSLLQAVDGCIEREVEDYAQWFEELKKLRSQLHDDPGEAAIAFQELVEWTYLLVRRAKRCEHGVSLAGTNAKAATAVNVRMRRLFNPLNVRQAWLRVCLFANAVVEASNWIAPGIDIFLNFEISKVLGLYGVALARLGRFYEAHRRLNHAEAILTDSAQPDSSARIGILELRRGETYMLEALRVYDVARLVAGIKRRLQTPRDCLEAIYEALRGEFPDGDERVAAIWTWTRPQVVALVGSPAQQGHLDANVLVDGFRRIVVARSDDAWGCFERAESLLAGQTHSPLWWSRLRAMQLLTISLRPRFTLQQHRPLATRVRSDHRRQLRKMWREGIAASPNDWYNRLRLLDYYVRALHSFGIDEMEAVDAELAAYVVERRARLLALGQADDADFSAAHFENVKWRVQKLRSRLAQIAASAPHLAPGAHARGDLDGGEPRRGR